MFSKKRALLQFRVAVSLFFFIQGIVFASWANRIPDIKTAMQLNDAQLGNVLFAIPIGQVTAMAISAWLVSKFGSRRMLILASVLYPFFLLPLGLADNPFVLMVGLFFYGMSTNLFNAASNTQGVNVESIYGKSIMASFHGMWSLGGFLGGLIGMAFVGMGVPPLPHFIVIFVLSILLMNFIRRQLVKHDKKAVQHVETYGEQAHVPLRKKFDPHVIFLGLMAYAAMLCEGCMYDWSGVYFMQVVHAPEKLVQLGYVVCLCTMTMGRFMADWFVTRYGARKVISVSGLLIFSGLMLAVAVPNLVVATVGFFFVGFGISSTVPICYSMAGHSDKMDSGLAVSTVSSVGYLGFLIGPPAIGHLAHAISLHFTFAVVACLGLLVSVGANILFVPKAERRLFRKKKALA